MIPWLGTALEFPAVDKALTEPEGLLAAGGDLSLARLSLAYSRGIFPWFSAGQPILWWSPAPRMVLFSAELKVSRSLEKTLRNGVYRVSCDQDFAGVMQACAQSPRPGQGGPWISPQMVDAYCRLHAAGVAHSFEVWMDGELVGGLYGVALGRMFFGESMFHRRTDASKIAFVHMVRHLAAHGFSMIDCQVYTPHLASLGGRLIARETFCSEIQALTVQCQPEQLWGYQYSNEPARS
ncbi:leucyl/phenylalanyl-tRNA--protein transferase [Aquitalea sp. S1-19]|nr:leucyl/phenylalanyl-tRNA--protein transferase [Aquitalea sp. S1-19]